MTTPDSSHLRPAWLEGEAVAEAGCGIRPPQHCPGDFQALHSGPAEASLHRVYPRSGTGLRNHYLGSCGSSRQCQVCSRCHSNFYCAPPQLTNDHTVASFSLHYHFAVARKKCNTTLQSMMNTKLSQHMFLHCYENGRIKMIQTITHNLYVNFKLTSLYCGLRLILFYPNP